MSGHSHAKTIKHDKEISDQKRGKLFSKLARMISVAAKEKGGKPETNSALRMAIEKAREINMPQENIERAIRRGTGELEEGGAQLEEVIFEAYGPTGIAIIIEGITDNKNRALGEIKQILSQNGGKMVGEGAVKWMFERKGVVTIIPLPNTNREELELKVIEAGAEDVYWHENLLDVYTKVEDLEKVKNVLEKEGIKIESASLDWVPKEMIEISKEDKEDCEKLFEALDESDSVQEIYSNLKD
jgi:YebC/PmpR family DNA-binding regulatory protein